MPRTIDPVVTTFGSGSQPEFDLGDGLTLRRFVAGDEWTVQVAFADPDIVRWRRAALAL